jgi:hypothetical protein
VYVLLGHVTYCLYRYFVDFIDFACLAQASQLVEPTQASSPHFIIAKPKVDVLNPSSSDTEEALNLLFLSPAHGPQSPASKPHLGSILGLGAISFLSYFDISLSCTRAPLTAVCIPDTYRMSG